jgi:hypothetical protein
MPKDPALYTCLGIPLRKSVKSKLTQPRSHAYASQLIIDTFFLLVTMVPCAALFLKIRI